MPPKGKPQPTVQDIELIKLWISEGGSFEKKIKDLVQTDLVKKLFTVSSGMPQNKNNSFLPDIKIEKVPDKILDSLKKSGIVVVPIANNSAFLSADFISLPNATDDDVAKLLQVSPQLTWLNLGGTKITDKSLSTLAQMPNLTKLNLNNTNISDGGLAVFPILKNLNYLNLTHTKIGLKGLFALSNPIKLPQLQQLYLFDTKIMLQDSTAIFKLFPNTKVILGSYQVSTLVSDTTVFKRKK